MPFCNKIYYLLGTGTTFCYLDDFCTGNSNQVKERVLLKELRQRLEEEANFNIREILREVYEVTRADMAAGEKDQFYCHVPESDFPAMHTVLGHHRQMH